MLDRQELADELGPHLEDGETVEAGFDLHRGVLVLTSRRLVSLHAKGWLRKRVEVRSIPYTDITDIWMGNGIPLLSVTADGKKLAFELVSTEGLRDVLERVL